MAQNSPASADALNADKPQIPIGIGRGQIAWRPRSELRTNPQNVRVHSKKQTRQIARSIKAFGFLVPIVVDGDGMVLSGHGRLRAAELLGMDLVPTIAAAGLSEAQKRAYVLADNKLCENAGWNRELLVKELGELAPLLAPLNWDLTLTGFEAAEIDALIIDYGTEKPDPADIPPAAEVVAVSRPGEIWLLGPHRLLCGDARSTSDLDWLMHGVSAAMVFADCPYNVKIADVQGRGRIKHPEFAFASGEMDDSQFITFLSTTLGNVARVSREGAIHYVCMDWRHVFELISASRSVYGREMLNLCVWNKTSAGQGSFYRSQHELVGVFRVHGAGHQNNIQLGKYGRNRSNVWTYPGISGFGADRLDLLAQHPTVKPVALVADAIRDCTTRGDLVLDPFMGSGTTILAAERTSRCAYGLEFEPRYVDVSIRRWEQYTKADAVLEGDGRSFTEIAAERLASPSPSATSPASPGAVENERASSKQLENLASDYTRLCHAVSVTPTASKPE